MLLSARRQYSSITYLCLSCCRKSCQRLRGIVVLHPRGRAYVQAYRERQHDLSSLLLRYRPYYCCKAATCITTCQRLQSSVFKETYSYIKSRLYAYYLIFTYRSVGDEGLQTHIVRFDLSTLKTPCLIAGSVPQVSIQLACELNEIIM